ncbi:DoxX family protein [Ornithinimicrobium sufpigmenti]|uniref:DoxX family protein n=1 Tax=Ornithinimicrobium sufpigmenti TaxID=2508882 RepID=UPI001036EA6D|nr:MULTISPECIES: DoxX family protein [unclassified Ornithinimicrobium]
MSPDRPAPPSGGDGGLRDERGVLDDGGARYHREVDDPVSWDDDAYALAGQVEVHGRGVDFGLLLLRCGSLVLVPHGLHKAFDMPAFTEAVGGSFVGAQAPEVIAWVVMLGQVTLPGLIAVGLFTRPAAFLLAAMMSAIWGLMFAVRVDYAVLGPQGALTGENALLYVALVLPLVFTGAGRWSLDNLRTAGRP